MEKFSCDICGTIVEKGIFKLAKIDGSFTLGQFCSKTCSNNPRVTTPTPEEVEAARQRIHRQIDSGMN